MSEGGGSYFPRLLILTANFFHEFSTSLMQPVLLPRMDTAYSHFLVSSSLISYLTDCGVTCTSFLSFRTCEQNDVVLSCDVQHDKWTASGPAELIPERWTLLRKKRALRYSKKENILNSLPSLSIASKWPRKSSAIPVPVVMKFELFSNFTFTSTFYSSKPDSLRGTTRIPEAGNNSKYLDQGLRLSWVRIPNLWDAKTFAA